MKKNIIIPVVAALALLLFFSCKKYTKQLQNIELGNKAYLKVIHAAPGFTQVFNMPDNFNIIVGGIYGQRIVSSFTYNSAFPVNTINLDTYAAVPAGAQDIRLVVRGVVNIDSVPITVFSRNLEAGAFYTLIITDSITTTSTVSKIWSKDAVYWPVDGVYALRFIHAVMNDTAGRLVDVFSVRKGANVFTNVAPGTVLNFAEQPFSTSLDTLIIRRPGATTWELARLNGISFSNRRVYTAVYRGNTTLTTGTRARGVILHNNR